MPDHTNTVEFNCVCGAKFRTRIEQGGKTYTCPKCGSHVIVPKVALAAANASQVDSEPSPLVSTHSDAWLKIPSTFGEMLLYLMGSWAAITVLLFFISLLTNYTKYIALLLFLVTTGVTIEQIWKLLRARQHVLVRKDVPLLWGFVRLIAWDPTEGVLILQNKNFGFSDDDLHDGRGGVRFLFPILGEELALRVPLEVQTLRFRDENVMTREFLSVTVSGTMKWRIVDIRKFYLLVSRELRSTVDHNNRVTLTPSTRPSDSGDVSTHTTIVQLLNAAIEWLRILAEEQTRIVVSRAKSGLLIADRLTHDFSPQTSEGANGDGGRASVSQPGEWGGAADGLAGAIHVTIAERLKEFGIAVDDVSLQEIKLPEEVLQECINACKAYYYPARAKREASFKGADLQAQADVLGRDALATREIVGSAPAYGMADFLSRFLQERLAPSLNPSSVAAASAAALAASTVPSPPSLPASSSAALS